MEIKQQSFQDKTFNVKKGSTHPGYSYFCFEEEEKDFRDKYWRIKCDDVVFDVGSSYGSYSLTALSMGATVFSFEPEKTVFVDLVDNIKINNWINKSFVHNFGLWDKKDSIHMNTYAPHWGSASISSDYEMSTLDDVVNKHPVDKIDWIKIDVEGAEIKVLTGGAETIKKYKPKMIIECHNFLDKEISINVKKLLISFGYSRFEEVDRDPCIMIITG